MITQLLKSLARLACEASLVPFETQNAAFFIANELKQVVCVMPKGIFYLGVPVTFFVPIKIVFHRC